jgi:hypothetical protein
VDLCSSSEEGEARGNTGGERARLVVAVKGGRAAGHAGKRYQ